MSDDLVERLRNWHPLSVNGPHTYQLCKEAADEIERLRAALEKIVSDELYNEAQMVVIAEAALKEVDDG